MCPRPPGGTSGASSKICSAAVQPTAPRSATARELMAALKVTTDAAKTCDPRRGIDGSGGDLEEMEEVHGEIFFGKRLHHFTVPNHRKTIGK